jgi:hypothetical protein
VSVAYRQSRHRHSHYGPSKCQTRHSKCQKRGGQEREGERERERETFIDNERGGQMVIQSGAEHSVEVGVWRWGCSMV